MLVLARKLGEKIYVGKDIVLTVVEIDRDRIRLGIDAPREVSVLRAELLPEDDEPQPTKVRHRSRHPAGKA